MSLKLRKTVRQQLKEIEYHKIIASSTRCIGELYPIQHVFSVYKQFFCPEPPSFRLPDIKQITAFRCLVWVAGGGVAKSPTKKAVSFEE